MKRIVTPAALAAALLVGAGTLAPDPATAQQQQQQRGGQRDWFESRDPMDRRDRFLRDVRQGGLEDRAGIAQGRFGDYGGFGAPWDFQRRQADAAGREAFERGYRMGRMEERRRAYRRGYYGRDYGYGTGAYDRGAFDRPWGHDRGAGGGARNPSWGYGYLNPYRFDDPGPFDWP